MSLKTLLEKEYRRGFEDGRKELLQLIYESEKTKHEKEMEFLKSMVEGTQTMKEYLERVKNEKK